VKPAKRQCELISGADFKTRAATFSLTEADIQESAIHGNWIVGVTGVKADCTL
jgi:hypothetical protein